MRWWQRILEAREGANYWRRAWSHEHDLRLTAEAQVDELAAALSEAQDLGARAACDAVEWRARADELLVERPCLRSCCTNGAETGQGGGSVAIASLAGEYDANGSEVG